mgnify:CR=1 FL=1
MADPTFTYDETVSTDLAKVRLRIMDTNPSTAMFTDGEVTYALTLGTVTVAALWLARRYLADAARQARSYSNEQGSEDLGSRVAHLQTLIRELELEDTATLPQIKFTHLGSTPSDLDYTS